MIEVKIFGDYAGRELLVPGCTEIPAGKFDDYVKVKPPETAHTFGISACLGIAIVCGSSAYLGHYIRPTKSEKFKDMVQEAKAGGSLENLEVVLAGMEAEDSGMEKHRQQVLAYLVGEGFKRENIRAYFPRVGEEVGIDMSVFTEPPQVRLYYADVEKNKEALEQFLRTQKAQVSA